MKTGTLLVAALFAVIPDVGAMDVRHVRLTFGAAKTPLPLTIVLPKGYEAGKKLPLVLALPPGSGNASLVEGNLEQFWIYEADERGYIVVEPEITGSTLSATAADVLDSIFAYLDANVAYDASHVILAGQSNGGLGAFFAALAAPSRFSGIIGLPAAYMGPLADLEKLQGKRVWLLVGELDTRWKQMSERTLDGLRLARAIPELTVVDGQGHVFPIAPKRLFDWMESVRQSRK